MQLQLVYVEFRNRRVAGLYQCLLLYTPSGGKPYVHHTNLLYVKRESKHLLLLTLLLASLLTRDWARQLQAKFLELMLHHIKDELINVHFRFPPKALKKAGGAMP